jgi:CoA:oxalate CoA-transferase
MTTTSRVGPLSALRILEASHMLAGPYCGMLLADLGADVIKIEPPTGDIGRVIGPHFVGPHNAYFGSLNRNKRSICLDLTTEEGQHALIGLVKSADGLVTNIRPTAIRKLGLTYENLREHNERLVCLALTGFGLTGRFSDLPAYDYIIQALTGVMAMTGDPNGPPVKTGYSAVDNSTGIMAAFALVAKILEGKGGQLDISLYDTMLSQLNYIGGAWLNAGERLKRAPDGAHPYIVPAQIFQSADGHLALFITHDKFWRQFALELGKPEWLSDERFSTMASRAANRALVISAITSVLQTQKTEHWVNRLVPLGVVVAGVITLDDALQSDLAVSRNMIQRIPIGDLQLSVIGNPIHDVGTETVYRPPPLLGEHTHEVLTELECTR